MVSICERSFTCRYQEQAKDAEKLEPKGTVAGRRYVLVSLVDTKRTGEESGPNPQLLLTRNTGNPYFSRKGKLPAR